MILIISTCKEKLHEEEFVRPIERIVETENREYARVHYSKVTSLLLKKAEAIIICGTSLKDNDFLKNSKKFAWIKAYENPLLGICSGMQIMTLQFSATIKKKTEIGFFIEEFAQEFLSLKEKQEVYHLHNNYITLPKEFEQYNHSVIPQAIKHKIKPIYGTLFHPEVRNKELVRSFLKISEHARN